MKKILTICFALLVCFSVQSIAQIPTMVSVQIVKAEDERRYDKTLEDLMKNKDEKIRARAALAAGRIGSERAVPILASLLENDTEAVRPTAAFALGEIESTKAADVIFKVLKLPNTSSEVRARLVEAAGKIAAANDAKNETVIELGKTILRVLDAETNETKQDRLTVLLGLTAILRAKPKEGDIIAAKFLMSADARVRADAANTLPRIKATNASAQLRAMLLSDDDAIARANAARALGAAEDKDAFDILLEAAMTDADSRVRVSAIRSLGSLKNAKAADRLLKRGAILLADYKKSKSTVPAEKSELLEIATTLGRILPNTNDEKAVKFLKEFRVSDQLQSPETEIAFARIAPEIYLNTEPFVGTTAQIDKVFPKLGDSWQISSSIVQGLAEFAKLSDEKKVFREAALSNFGITVGNQESHDPKLVPAIPDYLRAYAVFKADVNSPGLPLPGMSPNDKRDFLSQILRGYVIYKEKSAPEKFRIVPKDNRRLGYNDIYVRAVAAELLGEQTASKENVEVLKTAFTQALEKDKDSNDAQLAILSALVKLDKLQAASSLKLAFDAPDYLIRRHAAILVKQNDLTKDFPNAEQQIGTLEPYDAKTGTKLGQILNTDADYLRAVSRKNARAILTTEKGTFTIEFSSEAAPLTVDNFIKLAKANYFNGLAIHRVVPNFVMQDGDPRGDGNGGPGWQIRCELNVQSYERGAVGMALSGKDTGGSQWFVTHSPQPHLDGGYTIFGRVNESGMKVVDNLTRGDKILSVKIIEGKSPPKGKK